MKAEQHDIGIGSEQGKVVVATRLGKTAFEALAQDLQPIEANAGTVYGTPVGPGQWNPDKD